MKSSFNMDTLVPSFEHIVQRRCSPNYIVPPSVRDFHNFMFIFSGEGFCVHGNQTEAIKGPMLIYNPPGTRFGYYAGRHATMHIVGINVYLANVRYKNKGWILDKADQLELAHKMKIEETERLLKLLEKLVQCWSLSKNMTSLHCRSWFMALLAELPRLTGNSRSALTEAAIRPALQYVHKFYKEKITLETLSKEAGLAPSYFGMLFKEITGYSPIVYIHRYRIEAAKELIDAGFSVSEVSHSVGFQDSFYFSRVFKKVTGVSPKKYVTDMLIPD